MEIKDKAAIGIGVPLGIILAIILVSLIYLNVQKRKKRGAVTEVDLVELEAQKKAAMNPNVAGQIQWKPY
jgi:hypothetical protein